MRRAFTAKACALQEPRLREVVQQLWRRWTRRGRVEVMEGFARPLSAIVQCMVAGWPIGDRVWLLDAARRLRAISDGHAPASELELRRAEQDLARLRGVLERTVRRGELGGALGAMHDSGMEIEEVLTWGLQLVLAGFGALAALIGDVVLAVVRHDLWERVAAGTDPPLLEELIRFASPAESVDRVAAHDCQVGLATIARGDRVVIHLASANEDEDAFPAPHAFVQDRRPNDHVAFGYGPYGCQGAALSRLVLKLVLEECTGTVTGVRVVDPGASWACTETVRVLAHLPLAFQRRAALEGHGSA